MNLFPRNRVCRLSLHIEIIPYIFQESFKDVVSGFWLESRSGIKMFSGIYPILSMFLRSVHHIFHPLRTLSEEGSVTQIYMLKQCV